MGWMGPGHTSMAMCSWMLMVGFSPLRCVMHAVLLPNPRNRTKEGVVLVRLGPGGLHGSAVRRAGSVLPSVERVSGVWTSEAQEQD